MKASFSNLVAVCSIGLALPCASCGERSTNTTAESHPSSKPADTVATKSAHGPIIDGEQFCLRKIPDPQQGGMAVGIVSVPDKWKFGSRVVWNYAHHSSPVSISMTVENPTNEEALFAYPAEQFFCLRPVSMYYQPGQDVGGLIFAEQQPPVQTLAAFIRKERGTFPDLHWVGSKNLPGLPAALHLPPSDNQHGIGIKVTYEFKGKPVEEEFYAVAYSVSVPYDGPQGRTWQINWGLNCLHSFRAPAGVLDKHRAVFAAMAKSFRPNPAWVQRKAAIDAYLARQFNLQIQAGYNQIAAAARLSKQISANNDAMIASIDQQLQSEQVSGGAATRDSVDRFDDYIRGVDTVNDPYYGTSQHSYDKKYHWTDGYGSYRNSNDPNYNPNESESGNWQLMDLVK